MMRVAGKWRVAAGAIVIFAAQASTETLGQEDRHVIVMGPGLVSCGAWSSMKWTPVLGPAVKV